MGTDRKIEVAILIISALTLVAAGIAVYLAYPAWRQYRLKPLLLISLRPDGEGPLMVVNNNGWGQIVFLLTLHNDGNRAARFWRVWLAGQDNDTSIFLDNRGPIVEKRSFTDRLPIGDRIVTEVAAGIASDIVSPRESLTLPGRNTINFPLEKKGIRLDFKLDAEGMPTRVGIVRLEINPATRAVRVGYD